MKKKKLSDKKNQLTNQKGPKTILLAAYNGQKCQLDEQGFTDEFISLVKTAKIDYSAVFKVKLRRAVASHFLTKGKIEELLKLCQDSQAEQVICSLQLSPLQKRNLENLSECQFLDRNDLILDIFKKAAVSAEGRVQVKMAEIELMKTRISGHGEEMGQQQSGAMARGPGETLKEYRKRFFKRIYGQAKKELEVLQKARETQRKQRIKTAKPIVAIVGYTNAGKSHLINALTGSKTLVEDKLFATLDTTTKELFLAVPNKVVLISDTIGFISNIPHNLIEAFKSTLDELQYADLLLQVIDLSNPAWSDQIRIVNATLEEIEVFKPMIYVFNKIDKLTTKELTLLKKEITFSDLKPNIFISAKEGKNLPSLKQLIEKIIFDKKTVKKA